MKYCFAMRFIFLIPFYILKRVQQNDVVFPNTKETDENMGKKRKVMNINDLFGFAYFTEIETFLLKVL